MKHLATTLLSIYLSVFAWITMAQNTPFIPAGSYLKTSENVQITIEADLKKLDGTLQFAQITFYALEAKEYSNIINNNGVLETLKGEQPNTVAHSYFPDGSYLFSSDVGSLQVTINALCRNQSGYLVASKPLTFKYSEISSIEDISNKNGNLTLVIQQEGDFGSRKDGFMVKEEKKDQGKVKVTKKELSLDLLKLSEGKSDKGILDLATDRSGNMFAVGFFRDQFAMGEKSYTCLANAPAPTYFFAKFNPQGEIDWLKQFEDPTKGSRLTAEKIELDGAGNIYIYGLLRGKQNVDRSGGNYLLENTKENAVECLLKYNGTGQLIWAKQFKDGFYDNERDFVVDEAGNSYLLGFRANLAKINTDGEEVFRTYLPNGFTPGGLCLYKDKVFVTASVQGGRPINFTLSSGKAINLPKIEKQEGYFYNTDLIIAALSANDGSLIWADFIRSARSEEAKGIGVDRQGNVSVLGTCASNAIIGINNQKTLSESGQQVSFLCQYDENGNRKWFNVLKAKEAGATRGNYSISLSVDQATGLIYTTRTHCNKKLSWAVIFEQTTANGATQTVRTFGFNETSKTNNGFFKSSCGTANFFTHINPAHQAIYLFGEGRSYAIHPKSFGASGMTPSTGGQTNFFICRYTF